MEPKQKWQTREVMVGKVGVGGANPVRIQSMTTSNTRDVEATAEQIIRLADIGCEIARVTVQGNKEAEACEGIKNLLVKRGYDIPLVADIHFYPPAAMQVVDFVEKVRVNPGNFADRRASFKTIVYDEASYAEELERIEEKFAPLVEKCKKRGCAMRIGTNHGSLSDRIMNYYGDTPRGMVESAFEYTRVARKLGYHDIIFSMKASNPLVMVEAYRLLVREMIAEGWDYPLHLGVTEAGEGEDGRVKSSVGIGSLLLDGIGDTIRVSLTEDPWEEIAPCKQLVDFAAGYRKKRTVFFAGQREEKRKIEIDSGSFLHKDGTVVLPVSLEELTNEAFLTQIGAKVQLGRAEKIAGTADAIYIEQIPEEEIYLKVVRRLLDAKIGVITRSIGIAGTTLLVDLSSLEKAPEAERYVIAVGAADDLAKIDRFSPVAVFFSAEGDRLEEARAFFAAMRARKVPALLFFSYKEAYDDLVIASGAECGALLSDGLGDGVCLRSSCAIGERLSLSFGLLQACRMRSSKTEFISCPGCGRTLFNLQEVSARIRARTSHLPGVKIAIMGCIVNGPGEMADADFGYVGSRPGKVDLYIGKECVERNIEFDEADDRLVELIKDHGRWVEPEELVEVGK